MNYGVGEISDRLSILALKILYGADAQKETKHWRDEQRALLRKVTARTLNGGWFETYAELAAVNAAIWRGEDELREWRDRLKAKPPDETGISSPGSGHLAVVAPKVIQIAFGLQGWNDRRHELIEAINKEAGDHIGAEK